MSGDVEQEEPASSPVPAPEVEGPPEQSFPTQGDDTDIVRLEAAHRSGKPGEEAEAGPDSTAEHERKQSIGSGDDEDEKKESGGSSDKGDESTDDDTDIVKLEAAHPSGKRGEEAEARTNTTAKHEREGSTEPGDAEDAKNASGDSPKTETGTESTDGPAESNEETDCGFCVFMKSGPCGKRFSRWEDCVESAEKTGDNIVEKCWQMTQTLRQCMEVNPAYYGPVLQAEKSLQEEVSTEGTTAEAEVTVKQETENVETGGLPKEGRESRVRETQEEVGDEEEEEQQYAAA